jgi:hypothetical protein
MNQDDDIHLNVMVKGLILHRFYCMKTHHRHNRMQIDMRTTDRNYFGHLPLRDLAHPEYLVVSKV